MMIKKLDWDTDFFGFEIGELTLQDEVEMANADFFNLLYIKSSQEFELDIKGFRNEFFEEKIVFSKQLEYKLTNSNNVYSTNNEVFDINQLYELAYESGKYSRFKLDKKFQLEKFLELYRKWVDNSISNKFADDVLVFKEDNKIKGFITYKINNSDNFATIGLIAVNPFYQGKGIGKILLTHVENELFSKSIHKLLIPTQQTNDAACSFYRKQNYKTQEITYIKHYWRK